MDLIMKKDKAFDYTADDEMNMRTLNDNTKKRMSSSGQESEQKQSPRNVDQQVSPEYSKLDKINRS